MKRLLLLAFIAMSCGTVHKLTTSTKTSTDSTSVQVKDTSYTHTETTKQENLQAKDIDIVINYGSPSYPTTLHGGQPSDTVKWTPYYPVNKAGKNGQSIQDILADALSARENTGRLPTSVSIHIGSIGDTSTTTTTASASSVKTVSKDDVKKTETTKTKTVQRSSLPWWIYVVGGLVLLGAVVIGAFKLYSKLKI